MIKRLPLICCLSFLWLSTAQAQDLETLEARLDSSAIHYQVDLRPNSGLPLAISEPLPDILCRRKVDGQVKTTYFRLHGEDDILFLKAEKDMDSLLFLEARRKYLSLLDSFPSDTYLMTRIGYSHEKEGDNPSALEWYHKALAGNDLAFDTHRRAAGILAQGKDKESRRQALDYIIQASIMNRNDTLVEAMLEKVARANKSKYQSWAFAPRGLYSISPSGDTVQIDLDEKYWRGYALSQAAYLHEPGYKEGVIARTPAQKTVSPYRESLGMLYQAIRRKRLRKDPMLRALKEAGKKGMLEEYLIYEIFLPLDAYSYFLLDEGQKARIHTYVKEIKLRIKK